MDAPTPDAHLLGVSHSKPAHLRKLNIFLTILLALPSTPVILASPPVNQLIPDSKGPVRFSINPIALPKIPATNCFTEHKGPLTILLTNPLNIFKRESIIFLTTLSNIQNKIFNITFAAFQNADPVS